MIILKFGGTSVSSQKCLKTIANIVKKEKSREPVVVVSAISGVTDLLLLLINAKESDRRNILKKIELLHMNLIKSFSGKKRLEIISYVEKCMGQLDRLSMSKRKDSSLQDEIVSYGEIMSSCIISYMLRSVSISAKQVIATSLIVTDNNFGAAEFLPEITREKAKKVILPLVEKGIVPVITGFIGATKDGKTATFGRGGSDYTAAILGYALNAREIQIWTDVDGIFTTDPKFIKDASVLSEVSYKEASELAAFGAKILHPKTIRPAISAGISVRVLNTFNPDGPGTLIKEKSEAAGHIVAIAAKRRITLVNLYSTDMLLSRGFLARVFAIFSKYNISIDLVSVSEVSISVSLDNDENLQKAVEELETFATISISRQLGTVSLIGEGIVNVRNILKNIFSTLDKAKIKVRMISLGATDINISLVLSSSEIDECVSSLHRAMIKERKVL